MLGTILTLGAIYCIGSVVADRKRTKVRLAFTSATNIMKYAPQFVK